MGMLVQYDRPPSDLPISIFRHRDSNEMDIAPWIGIYNYTSKSEHSWVQ